MTLKHNNDETVAIYILTSFDQVFWCVYYISRNARKKFKLYKYKNFILC